MIEALSALQQPRAVYWLRHAITITLQHTLQVQILAYTHTNMLRWLEWAEAPHTNVCE